jgi:DNA-directed RNA polymerase subunit RPC12/RpoP
MFPIAPEIGKWYISVVCTHCGTKILMFPDLSEGRSGLSGSLHTTCPNCNHDGAFKAEHYHHDGNGDGDRNVKEGLDGNKGRGNV